MHHDRGTMAAAVLALVREAEPACGPVAAEQLRAVGEAVTGPLRVALTGRVSSGKSTLINALLGRRLAATAAGECTAVEHHYRHGHWTAATAVLDDGSLMAVPLPADGPLTTLPQGLDPRRIRRIEITDPLPVLQGLCLVDTPGLASASGAAGPIAPTTDADPAAAADAVLFVLNGPLHPDEASAVESFLLSVGGQGAGAVVAVLNKTDRLGSDPAAAWRRARSLASSIAADHGGLFSAVVPTVAMLGQAGQVGLSEEHSRAIVALADAWDADLAAAACTDTELFCLESAPVPVDRRRDLLAHLGLHGVAELLPAARSGEARDAVALSDLAYRRSGLPDLVATLRRSTLARAEPLKVGRALADLARLCGRLDVDPDLADRVDALACTPELLPMRLAAAMQAVAVGEVHLPTDLSDDLTAALSSAGLPRLQQDLAAERLAAWQSWGLVGAPARRRVAAAVCEAWTAKVSG